MNSNYGKASLALHKKNKGKIALKGTVPVRNKQDLAVAYTPGVAAVSSYIHENPEAVFTHTIKSNTIAVVSDGSAVLGLGNIGPEAALPVMEGKALLFKQFANVDAFPICLATQDVEEIIQTIKNIAPVFGGINLEDISAPRCFEIEERLKQELSIPVFHDDQHGTAIVLLAALTNALKIVKKTKHVSIVISGAGAAAQAVFHLLTVAGFDAKNIILLDRKGIIGIHRTDLDAHKLLIARTTNGNKRIGTLADAIAEADVFIGVSSGNLLTKEDVATMNDNPIIFAMANPTPEISYEEAMKSKVAVFGTGRSDYPNQINNVLVFPGLFRGVLDARVSQITDKMKVAAALALANLVPKNKLNKKYIIPDAFDKRVVKAIANAVKKAK